MEQQDSGRILRAIKRGSLLTVSRLTANYSIAALNELLINTDALLLASTNLAILSFLLDESQSSDSLPAAASLGIMGNKTLRVWREPSTHNSLLHVSATDGNLPVLATYLSRCPFTLELCNRSGQTALHLASQQGHLDCVRHLLSTGALPDLTDDGGNTALHYASQWNRPKVVDLLLQSGSNYGARNESGWMASDIAYDVSLQRHIESRVREMQEENRKAKARRRAQKEQQRNEQREREIRHVESEASLRSGASHSTTPGPTAVAAPGRPGYWPPPLRQDSINSPSIAAATTSIAVPSASSSAQTMSSGDVAASPSNTSTSDSSLPSHLQFAHGHGYDGQCTPFCTLFGWNDTVLTGLFQRSTARPKLDLAWTLWIILQPATVRT